jgi:O-antigen/teichoic acid export membrane protein
MAINVPAMIGLAVLSDSIIVVLFGENWRPSARILSVLALSGLLWPIHVINLQALVARGDSRTFLRLDLVKQAVGLITLIVGSFFGVMGLAWSRVIFSVIATFINAEPSRKTLNYGVTAQFKDIRGIALVGALMGVAVLETRRALSVTPVVELLILVPLGAFIYVGLGLALRLPIFIELMRILRTLYRGASLKVPAPHEKV